MTHTPEDVSGIAVSPTHAHHEVGGVVCRVPEVAEQVPHFAKGGEERAGYLHCIADVSRPHDSLKLPAAMACDIPGLLHTS